MDHRFSVVVLEEVIIKKIYLETRLTSHRVSMMLQKRKSLEAENEELDVVCIQIVFGIKVLRVYSILHQTRTRSVHADP